PRFLVLVLLHISSTMSTKILPPKNTSSWSAMDEDPQQLLSYEAFPSSQNSNLDFLSQDTYIPRGGYVAPLTIKDILDASSLTSLADDITQSENEDDFMYTDDSEVDKRSGALPPKRLGSVVELYRSVAKGLQPFLRASYRNTNADSRGMRELSQPIMEKPISMRSSRGSLVGVDGRPLVRRSVRRRRPAACKFSPFTLVCWQTQLQRRKMLNR
ncbi:unnamed protein product, partial [Meganyctiphanes norvegica]